MANNVVLVSSNIGALNNDVWAIAKVPTGLGGVTVLDAGYCMGGAGTVALHLCDLGTSGTAVSGTIFTKGSVVNAAGVPVAMTKSTAYVSEGHYIGASEANVGTTDTITVVWFSYVNGK
jgi:hypothetical protein